MMKRVLALILTATMLLSMLAGCAQEDVSLVDSSSTPQPESAATESAPATTPTESSTEVPAIPDSTFIPDSPENPAAIKEAAQWVREQQAAMNDIGEPDTETASFLFAEANYAYRTEDYDMAREIYYEVLESNPMHSGAINNLGLTLIQLEQYEEALRYCLLNRVVNQSFYAGWVNLMVASHALGFRPIELLVTFREEFPDMPLILDYEAAFDQDFPSVDYMENDVVLAYLYNLDYALMEYEAKLLDEDAQSELDLMLASGEISEEEYDRRLLEAFLNEVEGSLVYTYDIDPDEKDIQLLLDYFSALRILRERQQK